MNILIDIKHPAHVHVFRNFIHIMKRKGHKIVVTARKKEMTVDLLKKYNIQHKVLSAIGNSKIALIKELITRNFKILTIARKERPKLMMDIMGVSIAPVGRLLGIPSFVFYDTENAKLTNNVVYPLCTKFITPNCYKRKLGKKNTRYQGYHELAYLHPNYFTPDPKVLTELKLKQGETFSILRFVSWGASHDIGHKGISDEMKERIVNEFKKYGKVFITSEKPLSKELEPYRLHLPVEKIHSLEYYATLLYGESATMASECAVLGTHAIYLDNEGRGYTDEQEKKYQLVFNFTESTEDQEKSLKKGIAILKDKNSKKKAQEKREKLLKENIDLTKFMVDLVEKKYQPF